MIKIVDTVELFLETLYRCGAGAAACQATEAENCAEPSALAAARGATAGIARGAADAAAGADQ